MGLLEKLFGKNKIDSTAEQSMPELVVSFENQNEN